MDGTKCASIFNRLFGVKSLQSFIGLPLDVHKVLLWFISGVFFLFKFLSCLYGLYIVPLPKIIVSRLEASLVSHRRRTILMRDFAFSRTSYRRFGSNTWLARARRSWIRPGRTSAWWDNLICFTNCCPRSQWKENFRMSRPSLLKLSEELRPYGFSAERVYLHMRKTDSLVMSLMVWTEVMYMKCWTNVLS